MKTALIIVVVIWSIIFGVIMYPAQEQAKKDCEVNHLDEICEYYIR